MFFSNAVSDLLIVIILMLCMLCALCRPVSLRVRDVNSVIMKNYSFRSIVLRSSVQNVQPCITGTIVSLFLN